MSDGPSEGRCSGNRLDGVPESCDDPTCPVLYNVSGGVAHALPGQSCDNPAVITRMHLLEGTFTPENGAMATHNASGKLDGYINISIGNTVFCTYNEMGVYRRGGN